MKNVTCAQAEQNALYIVYIPARIAKHFAKWNSDFYGNKGYTLLRAGLYLAHARKLSDGFAYWDLGLGIVPVNGYSDRAYCASLSIKGIPVNSFKKYFGR